MEKLKSAVNESFNGAETIYNQAGGFSPTAAIVFDWILYEKSKIENVEIIGVLSNEKLVENRNAIVARLGFVAALMEKLGLSSKPKYALFESEAWAGENPKVRPSDDPKRREVLISSGMDEKNNFFFDLKEIVSIYAEDSMGRAGIKKKLINCDKLRADAANGSNSPLLGAFWATYRASHKIFDKDKKGGAPAYKEFIELAAGGNRSTFDVIFQSSLSGLSNNGFIIINKRKE